MGQVDIIEVLKKSELPMSGKQIAEALNQSWQGAISITIRKLREKGEVKCIELNRHQALKHFKSKRKLRIYYLNKSDLIKAKRTLPYIN